MSSATSFTRTRASFTAEQAHEFERLQGASRCGKCRSRNNPEPLKRCAGCRTVSYCDTHCQKSHWKKHKGLCNLAQGKGPKNGYLSKIKSPEEVYGVLIDSYRWRTALDHTFKHENHGMYQDGTLSKDFLWSQGDATDDFQRYIDLAEQAGVMPIWWQFENRMACLAKAVDKKNGDSVYAEFDEGKLTQKYGDDVSIQNALVMLAELVVGYDGKGSTCDEAFLEFQEQLRSNPGEQHKVMMTAVDTFRRMMAPTGHADDRDDDDSGNDDEDDDGEEGVKEAVSKDNR